VNFLQKILKSIYPVRMKFSEATGLGKNSTKNKTMSKPNTAFYSLHATLNNGKNFSFENLKGKFVLLVNTASNCGFTGQYDDLEKLSQAHKNNLVVLGFPANNFGGQEPGADESIAEFCRINYGVTFPLFQKASVKGNDMQLVFKWLSDAAENGWNNEAPNWNFCKYLVSPDGILLNFYSSAVSPLSAEVVDQIA